MQNIKYSEIPKLQTFINKLKKKMVTINPPNSIRNTS